jgi:mono/diheme cytochrome c family protein
MISFVVGGLRQDVLRSSRNQTLSFLLLIAACRGDTKPQVAVPDTVVTATVAAVPSGIPPRFATSQVKHGQQLYFGSCVRCHTADRFTAGAFAKAWKGRRVYDLYDLLASTMPQDSPGSMKTDEYLDVIAYLLQLNGAVPGKQKLTADTDSLKKMRIGVTGSSE